MKAIIGKMNDLVTDIQDKQKQLDAILKENRATAFELNEKASYLSVLEGELSRREGAVKAIEDVVKLKKDAESMSMYAQNLAAETAEAKRAWLSEKNIQDQLISEKRAAIFQESQNLEENRKALEIRIKKFDDEINKRVGEILKKMGIKQ